MTQKTSTTLLSQFEETFKPLLGDSARWEAFHFLAKELFSLNRSVCIVETGTLRQPGNWTGDGCSTAIWEWFMTHVGGAAISIDNDPAACSTAQRVCPHVRVINQDSVIALRNYLPPIDLLFLDSYDYSPGEEINAPLHQIAELGSIWSRLPSGALIASDDCIQKDAGKHVGTAVLMQALSNPPIFTGYITVWRKP